MAIFGSKDAPLRASAIPMLMKCAHRHMLIQLGTIENKSGVTADTGSAVHCAVDAWHKGADVERALAIMRERQQEFPLADLHDAELSFRPYTEDPRNVASACQATEIKVNLLLPPVDDDPTGENIYIQGKVDQWREDGVWDLKHSEKSGFELIHEYSYQLAIYGAALGVIPAGIINPRGYRRRNAPKPAERTPGVFFRTCWRQDHIDRLLLEFRREVARIRRGELAIRPGAHCGCCPAESFFRCVEYKL
jgi:hypothetical protein